VTVILASAVLVRYYYTKRSEARLGDPKLELEEKCNSQGPYVVESRKKIVDPDTRSFDIARRRPSPHSVSALMA